MRVALDQEAIHLHRVFFRSDPPEEVVQRYIAANAACGVGSDAVVDAVVRLGLDAEAVELALRQAGGQAVLVRKIHILFYLVEVRSAYYETFVGGNESRLRAALALLAAVMKTVGKRAKGAYLVRRHGLV